MKFAHIRVSEYFTFAKQIFHSEAISLARRANFVEKSTCLRKCFFLAGMAGFEPTSARVKVWCLTAWRHPNLFNFIIIPKRNENVNTFSEKYIIFCGLFNNLHNIKKSVYKFENICYNM